MADSVTCAPSQTIIVSIRVYRSLAQSLSQNSPETVKNDQQTQVMAFHLVVCHTWIHLEAGGNLWKSLFHQSQNEGTSNLLGHWRTADFSTEISSINSLKWGRTACRRAALSTVLFSPVENAPFPQPNLNVVKHCATSADEIAHLWICPVGTGSEALLRPLPLPTDYPAKGYVLCMVKACNCGNKSWPFLQQVDLLWFMPFCGSPFVSWRSGRGAQDTQTPYFFDKSHWSWSYNVLHGLMGWQWPKLEKPSKELAVKNLLPWHFGSVTVSW